MSTKTFFIILIPIFIICCIAAATSHSVNYVASSNDANVVSPIITQSPSDTPSDVPSDTPEPTIILAPTDAPTPTDVPSANYENYGWYPHNGQSMQYLNGEWFTTPQQDVNQQPQNSYSGSGSGYAPYYAPPPPMPVYQAPAPIPYDPPIPHIQMPQSTMCTTNTLGDSSSTYCW